MLNFRFLSRLLFIIMKMENIGRSVQEKQDICQITTLP